MSNESTNIIETMSAELEHLRPMEASLEMAEADVKAYKQRVADLEKEVARLQRYHDAEAIKWLAENQKLKERSKWHRQKDEDIYFECGKHWGAEYVIKMKDGTTHLAYGGCDEGGDGSVSTYLHLQEDDEWDNDYEWEYDDIDIWYEIPDPTIDGNIKEAK